jgi:hypothetical protein
MALSINWKIALPRWAETLADVIWGGKYEKKKKKGGKCKKGSKGKEKGREGKEQEKRGSKRVK